MNEEYKKKWYQANRQRLLAKAKLRQQAKREEIAQYKKEHYDKNKDLYKSRNATNSKLRREADPEKFRLQQNTKMARWRAKNPHIVAWRSILNNCIARMGMKKERTTQELLGYSAEELKTHIQSLWLPGMSWANYGEWHVDHISPIYTFDPETPPDVVNALVNLRPLWATTKVVDGIVYEGNLNRGKKWEDCKK